MRAACLAALLALAGCAAAPARPPPPPEALVVAFADEFHSGVIVPREAVPARWWPEPAPHPWLVLHYGERRWITGEAHGVWPAIRLALVGGEGGVQVDSVLSWRHRRGGTDAERVRLWAFPVSAAEAAALGERLAWWIDAEASPGALGPVSRWWPSSRPWTLFTNCHDFTADLLAAAGIAVERPPIMQAAPLRAALDRAWAARHGAPQPPPVARP